MSRDNNRQRRTLHLQNKLVTRKMGSNPIQLDEHVAYPPGAP